jgi:tetratricopeptide (TPR) repeat protein
VRRASALCCVAAAAASLGGCSYFRGNGGTPDNAPTIATLAGRSMEVAPDPGVQSDPARAIAAYRKFLDVAPQAPQRAEAMRRVAPEMDRSDARLASGDSGAAPDYRAAIARYQEFLKAYPKDPGNDRVLYQLARAQEQGGQLEAALQTLDRLVRDYPKTAYRDEAQFRRGELLFTARDYVRAEQAFAQVLRGATERVWRPRCTCRAGRSSSRAG